MEDSTIINRDDKIMESYLNVYLSNAYKTEGWFISEEDYYLYKEAYGDDFISYVAYDDETKQFYGNVWGLYQRDKNNEITLFSIASYYILPLFRGRGIGKKIFDTLIGHVKNQTPNINMCLVSANEMRDKYPLYNFNLERESYLKVWTPKMSDFIINNIHNVPGITLKSWREIKNWNEIYQYDQKFTSNAIDRSKFIKLLFSKEDGFCEVAYNGDGQVVGFIDVRETIKNSLEVGPFYADKPDIAKCLLTKILMNVKLSKKNFTYCMIKTLSNNIHSDELISEVTSNKGNVKEKMFLKFTKNVLPTREMLIYSTTDYTLSLI
uniref:Acetyltransf_18 domain-containing protein n=1 Tax=Parastrongyloides trichosuri TaxID=131310 RepID=A0A0N4ZVZ3_PARTI